MHDIYCEIDTLIIFIWLSGNRGWHGWQMALLLCQVKVTQSCPTLCNPMDCIAHGILQARILEWVAFPFSRGVFPAQGSNPGLPHCRQILYQLSHKRSSRILEWVAYTISSRSSWPRNQTGVSCKAGRFFTNWAIREAPKSTILWFKKLNLKK